MKFKLLVLCALFAAPFAAPSAQAMGTRMKQNTHVIDENAKNGFAIFRVSQPNADDMKNFCKLGITEIMVLSGDGHVDAALAQEHCPTLKVVYNEKQSAKVPMSEEFLADFDTWVKDAQASGKKIAFRCHCGCHRTGRLAAYYSMKYDGFTAKQANKDMKKYGKYMILFPFLDNQVRALKDYIDGKPCSEKEKYCVRKTDASSEEIRRALAETKEELTQ